MASITHKICSKCGINKPSSEYHKRKGGNGLQPQCKICRKRGKVNQPIPQTKVCKGCGVEYPRTREYFWSSTSNADRLHTFCISCARLKAHDYYESNKAECHRRGKLWAKSNPDKVKVIKKKARKPDPIGQKRRSKKWRDLHPDKTRMYTAKRRAKLRLAEGYHTADDLALQFKSQKGLCWWCGKKLGKDWHEDHIIPINRGGTNWPNNIVCSCEHCNTSRQDKLPHEWNGRLI